MRQFLDLDRGADDVDRVGVGHRLHAHRRIAADRDHTARPRPRAPGASAAAAGARGFDDVHGVGCVHGELVGRGRLRAVRGVPHCRGCAAPGRPAGRERPAACAAALPMTRRIGSAPSRPTSRQAARCATGAPGRWHRARRPRRLGGAQLHSPRRAAAQRSRTSRPPRTVAPKDRLARGPRCRGGCAGSDAALGNGGRSRLPPMATAAAAGAGVGAEAADRRRLSRRHRPGGTNRPPAPPP